MKNKNYFPLVLLLLILASACKKKEDDTITSNVIVHGNVRNNCTGNGFANVQVKFLTMKDNTTSSSIASTTDVNGDFTFSGLNIHSNGKYSYELYIENKDSYLSGEYGPSGIDVVIDKDKLSNFQQLGISASFKLCSIILPTGISVSPPDSFALQLEQRTLHFYE